MYITDMAIRNRVTVFVMAAGLIVFGAISYMTLPREAEPDITIPYIIVTTTYRGVSPADMETSVTKPIEDKLKSLRDVKKITSTSAEGISSITIEFQPTVEIDTALQKVRDKVSQARSDVPQEADDSQVSEINVSEFPIMMINIVGGGIVHMKEIAKDMQDDIETVRGVLKANVLGGLEREIRIEVDPDRLAAYNLPVGQLMSLVSSENVNVSGGSIDTPNAKFSVRVPGEFVDPREIETLVVHHEGRQARLPHRRRVDKGRVQGPHELLPHRQPRDCHHVRPEARRRKHHRYRRQHQEDRRRLADARAQGRRAHRVDGPLHGHPPHGRRPQQQHPHGLPAGLCRRARGHGRAQLHLRRARRADVALHHVRGAHARSGLRSTS